MIHESTECLNI